MCVCVACVFACVFACVWCARARICVCIWCMNVGWAAGGGEGGMRKDAKQYEASKTTRSGEGKRKSFCRFFVSSVTG